MDVHFQFLDLDLSLRAPADCVDPVRYAYRSFARTRERRATARVEWTENGVCTDREVFNAVPGLAPLTQLFPRFLDRIYDGLSRHALLHAAVVVRDGEAVLLAAPSGHGKSTLALELACRGWTLFSDDFAPLRLDDGRIAAFPRAVGIVRGSTATPGPFARAATTATHQLFGKHLIDPKGIAPTAAPDSEPVPLRHVFLLEGEEVPPRVEFSFAPTEEPRLTGCLEAIPGIRIVQRNAAPSLTTLVVETPPGSKSHGALESIAMDPAVLFSVKHWSRRTRWDGDPSWQPALRRETAQQLTRELLNRRPHGDLMRRYDGDTLALMIDLAGFLTRAECWKIEPGDLGATADAIERIAGVRS